MKNLLWSGNQKENSWLDSFGGGYVVSNADSVEKLMEIIERRHIMLLYF